MELKGSLSYSQRLPCPEPVESSPQPHTVTFTVRSPAKRPSELGKYGKRALQFLVGLVEGGDALLFIAKTYSCWKLTFAEWNYCEVSHFSEWIVA
jgi:hypothetical protein